jgi:hypothetical protein
MQLHRRIALGCAVCLLAALIVFLHLSTWEALFDCFDAWAQSSRAGRIYEVAVFGALFCFGMLLMMPFVPFCIYSGYAWGVPFAIALQSALVVLSSLFVYSVVFGLRQAALLLWIEAYIPAQYMAELNAIKCDRWRSARLNLLLCMAPLTYGAHVFIFALAQTSVFLFVPFFFIGMAPHIVCNVICGYLFSINMNSDYDLAIQLLNVFVLCCNVLGGTVLYQIYFAPEAGQAGNELQDATEQAQLLEVCTEASCGDASCGDASRVGYNHREREPCQSSLANC